ncbi:MAG: DnaD domain protein [Bacillota bacterium]|nr:DnaD domain protein [Bacillota bacterium]
MKNKQNNTIFLDIITDSTGVPNILLEYYRDFGLSEKEVLFLIELLSFKSCGVDLNIKSIATASRYSEDEIAMLLAGLVEHGFLSVNKKGELDLNAFFEKLREAWGWREAKTRSIRREQAEMKDIDKEFSTIYLKFQNEMGRPLSAIEGEQIKDWFLSLGMSGEMIYEALKKAVLLDKRNFQYINKILQDWRDKGYRELEDVKKDDQRKLNAAAKNKKTASKKYRDDQEDNIYEDVFEVN